MPSDAGIVPCVVFAYKRPNKMERILAALQTQDIDRLIVFVDGPREDVDIGLVEKSRSIAEDVDWVETELYFGEQNRGLPGINDNVGTVFNAYKSAVFVEEDCMPMPSFYSFMKRALRHYESQERVFSIGGYQPIPQRFFRGYPHSLVSSARFLCWGWATWRDRWELIKPVLSRYSDLFDGLTKTPSIAGHDLASVGKHPTDMPQSWDIKVAISSLWLEKTHLLSTRGLIRNIGLVDGVHPASGHKARRRKRRQNRNVFDGPLESICWLDNVDLNEAYAERMQQFVKGPKRTTWRRFGYKLEAIARHKVLKQLTGEARR